MTEIIGIIDKPALKGWAFREARAATLVAAESAYTDSQGAGLKPKDFTALVDGRAPKTLWQLPQKAADIGTLVHSAIEAEVRRLMGEDVPEVAVPEFSVIDGRKVATEAATSMANWHDWLSSHSVKFLAIERRVWSPALWYAGTLDGLAEVDGALTVIDFKTSAAVYDEYLLQIAAYRQCLLENPGDVAPVRKPVGGLILRLPKAPGDGFDAFDVPWDWQDELYTAFVDAFGVWNWKQQRGAA